MIPLLQTSSRATDKKNAIMIVDFTLQAQQRGLSPREAVREGCLLRLRPFLMASLSRS